MSHIPSKYKRKAERASYRAGYRAGYAGRDPKPETRHKDLQSIYSEGYLEGQKDYARRHPRVPAENAA